MRRRLAREVAPFLECACCDTDMCVVEAELEDAPIRRNNHSVFILHVIREGRY